jgi:hypothetical protein
MAQPIKYNASTKTAGCCISKGNYDIGVVLNYAYGPTASTGFWAGYPSGSSISSGAFVSYQNKASQGPSIYNIPSVNDLVYFGTQLNLGVSASTPSEVIAACSKINTIALVNIDYIELPRIDNNILTLDAGYTASYPWMDPNWFDVAGGTVTQANLSGGTLWVSGNSAQNYSDSYLLMNSGIGGQFADCPAFGSALQEFTVNIWVNTQGPPNYADDVMFVGQKFKSETNCNFAIKGNNTGAPVGVITLGGTVYSASFGNLNTNNWHMLTLTFDNTDTITTYLDGTQVNAVAGPSGTLVSNGLKTIIGGSATGTPQADPNTLNGYINAVNIWDVALEYGEITTLYNLYRTQRNF